MTVFTGHCVMMPIPTPDDGPSRTSWVKDVFAWLSTIEGDFDLLMIRKGAISGKEAVLMEDLNGLVLEEHILFVFKERTDAMLFHNRWVENNA